MIDVAVCCVNLFLCRRLCLEKALTCPANCPFVFIIRRWASVGTGVSSEARWAASLCVRSSTMTQSSAKYMVRCRPCSCLYEQFQFTSYPQPFQRPCVRL